MNTQRAPVETCPQIKKNGERCKARAMPNGKCRVHGGKSPKGIASGTYKHGRYSKYAPTRLQDRLDRAEHDPDLTSNRAELGLLTVRIQDLLETIANQGEEGLASETWEELYSAIDLRRRVNETERRRLVDLNQMVPVEQVFVLLGQVYDVITEHVTDRRTLAAIGTNLRALTSSDGLHSALPKRGTRRDVEEVSDVSRVASYRLS